MVGIRSRLACVILSILFLSALPIPGAPPRQDYHGDPLPEGAIARLGTTRLRHNDGVCRVIYSPDGKLLASLSRDRTLRVWDATSGKELYLFSEKDVDYYAVAWAPDSHTLAVAGDDPLHGGKAGIRILDLKSGKESKRLASQDQPAYFLAYSSDGNRLLAVSPGKVGYWDTVTGHIVNEWNLDRTAAIDVSNDHKTIAWVDGESEDRTVHLCDLATGKEIRRFREHQRAVVSVAISPDGKFVASGNPFEPIQIWDAQTGSVVLQLPQQQGGMHLRFSSDGKMLASACMNGDALLWELDTGKELPKLTGYRGWTNELAFSPDGKTLALAGADSQVIHLWDVATATEREVAAGHRDAIQVLAYSPDGKLLATGGGDCHGHDCAIYLWDAATGKEIRRIAGHHGKVGSLQFSLDGKRLASGSDKEDFVRVWDVGTGKEIAKLKREKSETNQADECGVTAVAWSPDGTSLLSAHEQGAMILWDFESGTELRYFQGHEGVVNSVAFSPDGNFVVSGSADRTVRVWDAATGEELRRLGDAIDSVKCVAYSSDGRLIAAGAGDFEGVNTVWEASTGREIARLPASQGTIFQIAFSPDGKLLAGTGADNALCLWEIATRGERRRFKGHPHGALAVAFSPDGRTIASGGQDTTVLLWDVAHCTDQAAPISEQDFEKLWNELGNADAKTAHHAICALLGEPEKTVKLIGQRLRTLAGMNAEDFARALSDLDHERYQIREKSTIELAQLGELAEPYLRQALERKPSLEVRQRIQLLLGKLETATLAPEHLRTLRAFELLERIGGNEARELFQAHAHQQPIGPLGREAKACLDRLAAHSQ